MSEKHSIAGKKRWIGVSDEERSKKMSDLAKLKQAKMSFAQKRKHALMMVKVKAKKSKE